MTARYYAVKPDLAGRIPVNWPVIGPHDTYDEAIKIHARERSAEPPFTYQVQQFERRVLLDVGSVAMCSEKEMLLLLHTDPMLYAVFTMGRHAGFEEARSMYTVDEGR